MYHPAVLNPPVLVTDYYNVRVLSCITIFLSFSSFSLENYHSPFPQSWAKYFRLVTVSNPMLYRVSRRRHYKKTELAPFGATPKRVAVFNPMLYRDSEPRNEPSTGKVCVLVAIPYELDGLLIQCYTGIPSLKVALFFLARLKEVKAFVAQSRLG
jgi:hypothetical protein